MGTVLQKFDADASAVEKELIKMRKAYDQLLSKVDEVGGKSEKSSKKQSDGMSKMLTGIVGAVGGYVSLTQALAVFNTEQERQIRLQKEAGTFTVTVAGSQAAIRNNLGDAKEGEFKDFLKSIREIQTETSFGDLKQLNMAAASILSATGGDTAATQALLRSTAPIFRQNPEELAVFAGGVADVANASGSSAEEATALALAGFGNSRTTSLAAFGNVAKTIASGKALMGSGNVKQDVEEITALFGTLSRFSGDSEGGPTKTAEINFLKKMEAFGGGGNLLQRLSVVQGDIASGKLKEKDMLLGTEAQSFGAIRDLLRGEKIIMADLTKTVANTKGSKASYDRLVNDLNVGTPQLAVATGGKAITGAIEESFMTPEGVDLALRDRARDIFDRVQQNTNTSTPVGFASSLLSTIGIQGVQDSISSNSEFVTRRQFEAETQLSQVLGLDGIPNTESQKRDAAILQAAVSELKKISGLLSGNARRGDARATAAAQAERD